MNKHSYCMIDGKSKQAVSPFDRGFNYGDGLFETMALVGRMLPLWSCHQQRLLESCARLLLPVDINLVLAQVQGFIAALPADVQRGVIKLVVTRGEGGRGYAAPAEVTPTICITYHAAEPAIDSLSSSPINLGLCTLRLSAQPLLAGIKHLNRLENVMARIEIQNQSVDEGLLLNQQNDVIEATAANVFIVKDNCVVTPILDSAGVDGVLRRFILAQFKQGHIVTGAKELSIRERAITLEDCLDADEIFLTNSLFGLRRVKHFNGSSWSQWPVAAVLQQHLVTYVGNQQKDEKSDEY